MVSSLYDSYYTEFIFVEHINECNASFQSVIALFLAFQLARGFLQGFIMKNFKYVEKLKEQ